MTNHTEMSMSPDRFDPKFLARACTILASALVLAGLFSGPGSNRAVEAAAHDRTGATGQPSSSAAPTRNTKISVSVATNLGKLPAQPLGMGVDNYANERPDPSFFLRTAEGKAQLSQLGIRGFFQPSDRNNWAHPYDPFTAKPFLPPSVMYTDEFLSLTGAVGATPILAVNVTTLCRQRNPGLPASPKNVTCKLATPQLAVKWLKHIKKLGKKVDYVAIGVEPYVGCMYWTKGINCTTKRGEHKIVLPQEEYAQKVITWAQELRKVFPNLKIGAHLQPQTYICRNLPGSASGASDVDEIDTSGPAAAAACGKSWDQTVLEKAGSQIDFVLAHQYFWIRKPVVDEATGQRMSYYQEQLDSRVVTKGATAMPPALRKELSQWLPNKSNLPIIYSEFNATSGFLLDHGSDMYAARQSLYSGLALGELFLDMFQPVQIGSQTYNGAGRAILHGFFSQAMALARLPTPLSDPSQMIYMPTWHVLKALAPFGGKTWVQVKVDANPQTKVKRPALRAYAVKSGKTVWLAVFNHHTLPVQSSIQFKGLVVKSGKVTRIGHNAAGFLTQNDELNPAAILPEVGTLPVATPASNRIAGFSFPPHSFTLLEITGK